MGVLLREVLLTSFVCIGVQNVHVHIHMLAYRTIILLFNVDSSKTQKPGTIVSLDLTDPQQSMLSVRTRGQW